MSNNLQTSTVKNWKHNIDPQDTWLKYECSENNRVTKIYCCLCRSKEQSLRGLRNFNPSFINGIQGASLKKDNCIKHVKSEMHKYASNNQNKPKSLNEFFANTSIGKSMLSVNETTKKRVHKLIDISYVLAVEEIAFNKFPKLIALEKRHGVDLGDTYNTVEKCEEFTECIAEDIKSVLKGQLTNTFYFSVCCDGSTDVSVTEKEIIYIIYVDSTECDVKCEFLTITDLQSGKAIDILASIKKTLLDFGIDEENMERRLVGFLADGASVNLGQKKGVAAELKKQCPWLLSVHCLNHRLELSIKDYVQSTYLSDIFSLLTDIHEFYCRSPSRLHQFRELASVLNEDETASLSVPTARVQGIRWISHKKRSLDLLLRNYSVIIQQLENLAASENTTISAKLKGFVRKLKNAKFVVWALFFNDVLLHFSKLSLALQCDQIDMAYALSVIQSLYSSLTRMQSGNFSDQLSKLAHYNNENTEETLEFQGIPLTQCSSIETFKGNYKDVLKHLYDTVYSRFADLHESELIISANKILQDKLWPTDLKSLELFGIVEITYLCDYYKELMEKHRIFRQDIYEDWSHFKMFWQSNLRHLSGDSLWKCVSKNYKSNFANLCHIINILRVFPVSNAKVERAFSTMKRVKNDLRNRLRTTTLDNLLRISINSTSLSNFSPQSAAELFFSKKKRRPETTPYGQREKKPKLVSVSPPLLAIQQEPSLLRSDSESE